MTWKAGRLRRANAITQTILDYLKIDYRPYFKTGHFAIDLGQPTELQYFSSTGAYAFFLEDDDGERAYPKEHEYATTPKRFYEQVLMQYIEDIPPWVETREALKGRL
jgi:hypothetical protein